MLFLLGSMDISYQYCSLDVSESVLRFIENSPLLTNQEHNLTLSWNNIIVKVKKRSSQESISGRLKNFFACKDPEDIKLLDNVNGCVQTGNLVAVLGSSGCGKTSLLAAVSGRIKGAVTGEKLLCGRPVDDSLIKKISGFVPQQDIAIETLTAKEHLKFMSHMRIDRDACENVRNLCITSLLEDLNLTGCENTLLSAMSGGERRRLSLAVELLTDPPLLLCDEPTTGLDSYSAYTVVEKLHHLASRGKAIICSIHQPASDTLTFFHKVILMACGRVAFQGTFTEAHTFFSSQGFTCPAAYNPAEFYIQKLAVVPGEEDDSLVRIKQLCEAYSAMEQEQSMQESVPHIQAARNSVTEITTVFEKFINIRKPHWHTQVYWLIWRSILDSSRSKSGHAVQVSVFLVTSVILSLCFMNTEAGTQMWVQDIRGLLYLISSEVFFTSAYSVFNTFPHEIPVFLRESGLYSTSAYYFSKMVSLIPRAVVEPVLYVAIIFMMVDFASRSLTMFLLMLGPIVIISNSATAYGCMLSALFESPDIATVVAVPVDLISLIMAGIFYNVRVLPASLLWMKYLSQFYYSNEALAVIHWKDVDYIKCPNNTNLPCLQNGQQVLNEYGFKIENLYGDLMILGLFYLVLHFVGYLGVWRRSKRMAAY